MCIRIKWVHAYKYKDNSNNIYEYFVLQTKGCSYLFWLMVNGIFLECYDNDIDMMNNMSERKLIRVM